MSTIKMHNNRKTVQQRIAEGTATRPSSGVLGGSKCTNHSRPLWYNWCRAISGLNRLKKTSCKTRRSPSQVTQSWDKQWYVLLLHLPRWITTTFSSTYIFSLQKYANSFYQWSCKSPQSCVDSRERFKFTFHHCGFVSWISSSRPGWNFPCEQTTKVVPVTEPPIGRGPFFFTHQHQFALCAHFKN